MGTPTRAVGYCRVSTQEQAREGVSVSAQEAAIRAYCAMRDIELVTVIVDAGVSASQPLAKRPGGAALVAHVETGRANAVVATKLDRLFRDAHNCLGVTRDWERARVAMHLVDLNVDTSTAVGRLFLTMMAAVAEMERNLIGERTAAALAHVRAEGGVLGGEALGWRRVAKSDENGRRVVEEVPEERAVACRIVDLYLAGMSLRGISATLKLEGRQTKRQGRWHPSTVRGVLLRELGEGYKG